MKCGTQAVSYVKDLFLTFEIPDNELLFNGWAEELGEYSEELLNRCWRDIMAECRIGYLPALKIVRKILVDHKRGGTPNTFIKYPTPPKDSDFSKVCKLAQEGLTKIRSKEWTVKNYYLKCADLYEEIGLSGAEFRDAAKFEDRKSQRR